MGRIKIGKSGLQAQIKMPEPQQPKSAGQDEMVEQSQFQSFSDVLPALLDLMPPAPAEVDLTPLHDRLDTLETRLGKAEAHHGNATEYISRLEQRIDQNMVDITQKMVDNGNKTIVHHKDHNADIGELQRTVKKLNNELEKTKSNNSLLTAIIFFAIGVSIAIQFI